MNQILWSTILFGLCVAVRIYSNPGKILFEMILHGMAKYDQRPVKCVLIMTGSLKTFSFNINQ